MPPEAVFPTEHSKGNCYEFFAVRATPTFRKQLQSIRAKPTHAFWPDAKAHRVVPARCPDTGRFSNVIVTDASVEHDHKSGVCAVGGRTRDQEVGGSAVF